MTEQVEQAPTELEGGTREALKVCRFGSFNPNY